MPTTYSSWISTLTAITLAVVIGACSGAQTTVVDGGGHSTDDAGTGDGVGDGVGAVCGNGIVEAAEVCDGADLAASACGDLPGFVAGTLACAADCGAYDTSMCEGDPSGPLVRINELTASEVTAGPYAGAEDAIEFYNAGGAAADLSGYLVSDESDFPEDETFAFPSGTVLAPGAFLVIVKLDETTGVGDYPFGLSASNEETLGLADPGGVLVDSVSFDGPDAEIAWCRIPDGDGEWTHCVQTFGASNADGEPNPDPVCGNDLVEDGEDCDGSDLDGEDCESVGRFVGGTLACDVRCTFDTGACAGPQPSLVVLNELTSANADDIELYNAGARDADLSGWIMTDDIADPDDAYDLRQDAEALIFPEGTVLAAGEYLVVTVGPIPGHPFGLGGGGDNVALLDDELVVVDFVSYGADEAATSYCRIPDGPDGQWQADCTPTFGDSNAQ